MRRHNICASMGKLGEGTIYILSNLPLHVQIWESYVRDGIIYVGLLYLLIYFATCKYEAKREGGC